MQKKILIHPLSALYKAINETDLLQAKQDYQYTKIVVEISTEESELSSRQKESLAESWLAIAEQCQLENPWLALLYGEKAKAIYEMRLMEEDHWKNELHLAQCYFQFGVIYGELEIPEREEEYYLKSLEALDEMEDCKDLFSFLSLRGEIFNNLSNHYAKLDKALLRFKAAGLALANFRKLELSFPGPESSFSFIAGSLNMASTLYDLGKYEEALCCILEPIERHDGIFHLLCWPAMEGLKALCYDLASSIYFELNSLNESLAFGLAAIKLFEAQRKETGSFEYLEAVMKNSHRNMQLSNLLKKEKEQLIFLKAYLHACLDQLDLDGSRKNLEQAASAHEIMAKCLQDRGQNEQAKEYLRKAKALRKQLSNQ